MGLDTDHLTPGMRSLEPRAKGTGPAADIKDVPCILRNELGKLRPVVSKKVSASSDGHCATR